MPVLAAADKADLTAIDAIYGDVPAPQIIWTDSAGRLPCEQGYANPPGSQQVLESGGSRPSSRPTATVTPPRRYRCVPTTTLSELRPTRTLSGLASDQDAVCAPAS